MTRTERMVYRGTLALTIASVLVVDLTLSLLPSAEPPQETPPTELPPVTACWITKTRLPTSHYGLLTPSVGWVSFRSPPGDRYMACHFTTLPGRSHLIVVETESEFVDARICPNAAGVDLGTPYLCSFPSYERGAAAAGTDIPGHAPPLLQLDSLLTRRPKNPATGLPASLSWHDDLWWPGEYRRRAYRYLIPARPVSERLVFTIGAIVYEGNE